MGSNLLGVAFAVILGILMVLFMIAGVAGWLVRHREPAARSAAPRGDSCVSAAYREREHGIPVPERAYMGAYNNINRDSRGFFNVSLV